MHRKATLALPGTFRIGALILRIKPASLPSLMACGVFASLGYSPCAYADQQSVPIQKIEKIEVTGSNIRRTDIEGITSLQIISREEIERTGKANVAEVLRTLPSNAVFNFDETWTNGFSPGGSAPALRGMSQKYTLVLVNGRRVANYAFGQEVTEMYVDVNSIPTAAVERIEVLQDGASAIYGSEAVGGVINIVLRSDYRGAEVGADLGASYENDLHEKRFHVIGGVGDRGKDKYNVVATFNFLKRDLLTYADRDWLQGQDFRDKPGGLLLWNINGGTYRTNPRQPFATCPSDQIRATSDFNITTVGGTVCAFNPARYFALFPEVERYQGMVSGQYDFSDSLSAFAELLYSRNRNFNPFRPIALNTTSIAFNPATGGVTPVSNELPVGNPSNPFGTPVGIQYSFHDVGGVDMDTDARFYRIMSGLKGTFRDWDWQTSALHSEHHETQTFSNFVDRYVLERVIADGSYNFLNPAATPDATNALRINIKRDAVSKLDAADFKATTDLMQLTNGPLGFATGLEWRRESVSEPVDPLLSGGNAYGRAIVEAAGARNAAAAFVEFNVPILEDLEANLASRYDRYSDFGSAVSPKGGFKWRPFKAFLLRGSVARGFRAPTLRESSNSAATFFSLVEDPDDPLAPGALVRIAGIQQSNPDLEAEKTRNANLGFVFAPNKDTSVGLTYYRVKVVNRVSTAEFQTIVDNPANFPGQIIRNSVGELLAVITRLNNDGELRTSGFDLDFSRSFSVANAGKFTLASTWSYVRKYSVRFDSDSPLTNYAGSNGYFGAPIPRGKGVTTFTWKRAPWIAALTHTYIHSFRQDFVDDSTNPGFQKRVGAYRQYDLYGAYEGVKNLRLFGSIRNVLNERPPFDPAGGGLGVNLPYDVTTYDARGRYFTVGLTYKFK